jgi:hypothetical protein
MGRMCVGYTLRKYNYTELNSVEIRLRYSNDKNALIWKIHKSRSCFARESVIPVEDLRGVILGNRSVTFKKF